MEQNNAQSDLEFIKKIISDSKRVVEADGKTFIFWGILVAIGLLLTYFFANSSYGNVTGWLWIGLILFGWLYTFITEKKTAKKQRAITFASKILAATWISLGLAMTIIAFIGPISGAFSPIYTSPILSVILGIGYIISGVVLAKKWFSFLAAGWWIGAIAMFFMANLETLIIMAFMMILFQTIPGIILFKEIGRIEQ